MIYIAPITIVLHNETCHDSTEKLEILESGEDDALTTRSLGWNKNEDLMEKSKYYASKLYTPSGNI